MRINRVLTGCLMAVSVATGAAAGENGFQCVTDQATGFKNNGADEWHPQVFIPWEKYLLRPLTSSDRVFEKGDENWGFFEANLPNIPSATCARKAILDTEEFICRDQFFHLNFSLPTLRFVIFREGSYGRLRPDGPGHSGKDIVVEIGRCSPL